jgi:DNA-binding CsgD family transcriptional regulator
MQRLSDLMLPSATTGEAGASAALPEDWQELVTDFADRLGIGPGSCASEPFQGGCSFPARRAGYRGACTGEPETVASVVQAIYAAAMGDGQWNTAAACIARLLDSDGAAVLLLAGTSFSDAVAVGVAQRSSAPRIRLGRLSRNAAGEVDRPVSRVPMLVSWALAEPDLSVGLLLVREDLSRDFDPTERSLFDAIFCHVRRAADIASRLLRAESDVRARGAAMEALGLGLVVMSGRAEILRQNQTAAGLLQRQCWLRQQGRRIHAVDRAREPELQSLLASIRQPSAAEPGGSLVLQAAGSDPLCLAVVPFREALAAVDGAPDDPAFALVLSRLPARNAVPLPCLSELFGLSQAEARVFACVAEGCGVPETAERLGIGQATARTHLLNLFRKTGAQSQSDIVRLAERWAFPVA